jgi:hypothetical protein
MFSSIGYLQKPTYKLALSFRFDIIADDQIDLLYSLINLLTFLADATEGTLEEAGVGPIPVSHICGQH